MDFLISRILGKGRNEENALAHEKQAQI